MTSHYRPVYSKPLNNSDLIGFLYLQHSCWIHLTIALAHIRSTIRTSQSIIIYFCSSIISIDVANLSFKISQTEEFSQKHREMHNHVSLENMSHTYMKNESWLSFHITCKWNWKFYGFDKNLKHWYFRYQRLHALKMQKIIYRGMEIIFFEFHHKITHEKLSEILKCSKNGKK